LEKRIELSQPVRSVYGLPLVSGNHAFLSCVCVEIILKKYLLLTTIFIHYTNSFGCAPTFVGKQSKNHVCGSQGHEDEDRDVSTTSKDVLGVPDVVVKLSDQRRAWTYGSVGVGVDYGPKIWK
jgi:hypothetical protein